MLTHLIEEWARRMARKVGQVVAKSGLSPNALTILGFLLNIPAMLVIAKGDQWFLSGVLILFAGSFDMLDGAVAKVTNKSSTFGAFLDSTLDRYGEAVVFAGLLYYYANGPKADQLLGSILVYVAIGGSLMVSYVKARAEGLGIECKGVGLLPRPDRVLLIAFGCILYTWFGWALLASLWILALGTNFTAVQRIGHIWLEAKRQGAVALTTAPVNTPTVAATPVKEKEAAPVTAKETESDKAEDEALMRRGWLFRRAGGR